MSDSETTDLSICKSCASYVDAKLCACNKDCPLERGKR